MKNRKSVCEHAAGREACDQDLVGHLPSAPPKLASCVINHGYELQVKPLEAIDAGLKAIPVEGVSVDRIVLSRPREYGHQAGTGEMVAGSRDHGDQLESGSLVLDVVVGGATGVIGCYQQVKKVAGGPLGLGSGLPPRPPAAGCRHSPFRLYGLLRKSIPSP